MCLCFWGKEPVVMKTGERQLEREDVSPGHSWTQALNSGSAIIQRGWSPSGKWQLGAVVGVAAVAREVAPCETPKKRRDAAKV